MRNPLAFQKILILLSLMGIGMVTLVYARELEKEEEALVQKMIVSSYSNEVRYLSKEDAKAIVEQTGREMKEVSRIMEPYICYFETNTPVLCGQLLSMISEAKILAAIHELGEIRAGCHPKGYEWSQFENYRRNSPGAKDRCALVEIQILWCLYQAIPLAEKMDLDRAAEIFIEEKSYDDWSDREKDEMKRGELQHHEAYLAARRCLEYDLLYPLRRLYKRIEDDLIYRLDRDRRENRLGDFNRFANEIRRVVKDAKLAGKLIRADGETPHHASERRFKRIEEIIQQREKEGMAKIDREEKRHREEYEVRRLKERQGYEKKGKEKRKGGKK